MVKLDIDRFKKILSINIKLFEDDTNDIYSVPYNKIVVKKGDQIKIKSVTFINNYENKFYYLVFGLYSKKIFKLLGDYKILTQEEVAKELTVENKSLSEIGIFDGTTGIVRFTLEEVLEEGGYELIIFAKEINHINEFDSCRDEIVADISKIYDFNIVSSAPFTLRYD